QHITPGLKSLHWLKVEQRIQYKLISLTYSSLQHNSPLYLRRLLTIPTSHRSTRSTSVVTLFKPSVKLETGKRSFSFAAPFLWSTLPNEMRQPSADGLFGCLALARGPFHVSKLISSSSHIHLSNLLFFHHCTWNSTRNAHGLRFMINYLTPLPTNPAMPGRWRRSWASAHTH